MLFELEDVSLTLNCHILKPIQSFLMVSAVLPNLLYALSMCNSCMLVLPHYCLLYPDVFT